MSGITPRLGVITPTQVCGYETGGTICGAAATWHVIWTPDGENGAACDRHMPNAKTFAYWAAHRYEDVCGAPNSVFSNEENRCHIPGEDGSPCMAASAALAVEANR